MPIRLIGFLIGVNVATKPKRRVLKSDTTPTEVKSNDTKPVRGRKDKRENKTKPQGAFGWFRVNIFPGYFVSSWKELRLVTWPNRKETRQLTTAVILFAIAVGVVVALIDVLLDKIFKKVILKQ